MADEIKQLAFKNFTSTEITNGTAANVLTTDASTHYVIKGIEATQGNNADPVQATATLGLTAGLAAGEYTSLGTVAKADRVGLSGSSIMDASSTLTIRPVAKAITFSDEKINQGMESATNCRHYVQSVFPSVNGNSEPTLNAETTIDKTSVTYSGGNYNTMQAYPSGNHIIQHTNANGVDLRILFSNGGTSGTQFEVWNADGTYYGFYTDSYDRAFFDGERYIFWVECGGASTTRVKWYDLDESTTNLLAANTTGGGNGTSFYHGRTALWNDSPSIGSRSTYNNHYNFFYKNRHTDGRRYMGGYSSSNANFWMCELPATLNNDDTTTPTCKWLYLNGSSQSTNGTDPFGNNAGSTWNMTTFFNQVAPYDDAQVQLTYDKEKEYYFLWFGPQSAYWYCFAFTQADWDTRNSGNRILNPQNDGHGLRQVSSDSFAEINMDTNVWENYSSSNGYIRLRGSNTYARYGNVFPNLDCPVYIDGKNWYFKDDNGGNTSTYLKCVKVDMKSLTMTNMLPNTTVSASYNTDLFVSFGVPTSLQISSRAYTLAPSLKVRVTGILSDQ